MEIATLSQLKKELKSKSEEELLAICLRLGRFKKENKELMHYLLLEADNEAGYIEQIKLDIDEGISEVNTNGLYYAKKGIRKVLKMVTKQIRFSGIKETEVIVLLYFCKQVLDMEIRMSESRVLVNLLNTQFKKVLKAKSTLHEDLQFDYKNEIDEVMDRLSRLEARSLSYGY